MYRILMRPLRIDPMLCGLFIFALSLVVLTVSQFPAYDSRPVIAELDFRAQ